MQMPYAQLDWQPPPIKASHLLNTVRGTVERIKVVIFKLEQQCDTMRMDLYSLHKIWNLTLLTATGKLHRMRISVTKKHAEG